MAFISLYYKELHKNDTIRIQYRPPTGFVFTGRMRPGTAAVFGRMGAA
jgi:hypothetical protein